MVAPRAGNNFPGMAITPKALRRGVLPSQQIQALIDDGAVQAGDVEASQLQPASFDLRLGAVAYQMRASLLPGRGATVLDSAGDLVMQELDLSRPQILQKGSVYLIPALESLALPQSVAAKANPKSTTGRLDVFSRLITDHSDQFDWVRAGYGGPVYVEVAPRTFNVRVSRGTKLNQLRFLKGRASQSDASRKAARSGEALVLDKEGNTLKANVLGGVWLTVDLEAEPGAVIGWKARLNTPVVDFEKIDFYDPLEFWEPIRANAKRDLILNPGEFYILNSKERVRIPPAFAAEMVPYDPGMGEFRAHYAGFFDPGFGYGMGDVKGTRAVLEVRSYDVPYLLRDGQSVARLIYETLIEEPSRRYGVDLSSSYQNQYQGLAKQFRRAADQP